MKKSGIQKHFTTQSIKNTIIQHNKRIENGILQIVIRIGEQFVNDARSTQTYKDQTGNLRASIGYIVVSDGKTVSKSAGVNKKKVHPEISALIDNAESKYKGIILFGFAGMEYAAAVESKGFDVISNSAPTADILKKAVLKFTIDK